MTVIEYVEARTKEYGERLQRQLGASTDLRWITEARIAQAAVDAVTAAESKLSMLGYDGRRIGDSLNRADGLAGLFENSCVLCGDRFDTCGSASAQVSICGFCRDAILKREVRDDIWEIAHPAVKPKE